MNKDAYTKKLESEIKSMLIPIKGIPFNLIIDTISGYHVIEFNKSCSKHRTILQNLKKAA